MLCKSLIQFSIYGWSCVPSLLFTWPNYAGGDEDDGDLLQKISCMNFYTQCPQSCSRPPLTHASTGDSWTVTGKSGPVSCEVTAPFSCVLVHTKFCLCPPRVYFPVLYKFWQLYGRVNGDLLQEGLYHPQVCCTQPYSSLQHPDCGFPLIGKDKRLMEVSGMKKLNKGATGSCSDRWGYAQ